jgi:predicted RNA-binding Zn-ribbon protein involved in translation (DUF1610 family)
MGSLYRDLWIPAVSEADLIGDVLQSAVFIRCQDRSVDGEETAAAVSRDSGGVAMTTDAPCPYCHHVGLVRVEHVIRKDLVVDEYECGKCGMSWRRSVEPTPLEVKGWR